METANATARTFPAVRNSAIPGGANSDLKAGRATSTSMFNQSKNCSTHFLDEKGGGDTNRTTATGTTLKGRLGFRNHSLALGSTVRHF